MKRLFVGGILMFTASVCYSEGSAWLPAPGSTNLSVSYVHQSADEFYIRKDENQLANDLEQDTLWLTIIHGVSDNLALDARIGYAESNFDPGSPSSFDGTTDSSLGVTWRFHDEFISETGLPSAALRIGATLQGDYDTGSINSIGDGADSLDLSLHAGKILSDKFGISGEIGYRSRNSGTPDELLYKVAGFYSAVPGLIFSIDYSVTDARSGSQIGEPGFRFSELEEDVELINTGASYNLTEQISASASYASVLDGRNTSKSDIYALTLGYSF